MFTSASRFLDNGTQTFIYKLLNRNSSLFIFIFKLVSVHWSEKSWVRRELVFCTIFFILTRVFMAAGFYSWRNKLFLGVNQQPSVSNWLSWEPQRRGASSFKARRLNHSATEAPEIFRMNGEKLRFSVMATSHVRGCFYENYRAPFRMNEWMNRLKGRNIPNAPWTKPRSSLCAAQEAQPTINVCQIAFINR